MIGKFSIAGAALGNGSLYAPATGKYGAGMFMFAPAK
jgi:hypothetical protein